MGPLTPIFFRGAKNEEIPLLARLPSPTPLLHRSRNCPMTPTQNPAPAETQAQVNDLEPKSQRKPKPQRQPKPRRKSKPQRTPTIASRCSSAAAVMPEL
ncbi:hypothetical protein HMPREF9004_1099 [Schaalia cardiffensis F0333]|uniref:Uncharacterized protein n=1 Tax=Schaalia cardiffensis F0333 TaxID=888050 RepID=N6W6K1_9ACTO|nr:hypothetical protein [Schaalia cardiffensis]ENO18155.1 hypothetical protein HMPREF9004_1099 [Schaalia cardiffensis F0333]